MIKRFFDLTVASAGLILASPVLLTVAALVRLLTGPPVFFKQARMGKGGRRFTLIKFRTMAVSPGAEKKDFEPGNLNRVTPLGRLLEELILGGAADPEKTYRDEILPHKLALYEDYIRRRNFFADIAIIMKTVFSLFRA